jgi:hypothetical protein
MREKGREIKEVGAGTRKEGAGKMKLVELGRRKKEEASGTEVVGWDKGAKKREQIRGNMKDGSAKRDLGTWRTRKKEGRKRVTAITKGGKGSRRNK